MPKISKSTVDSAQAAQKDSYIWDDQLKGFGLKITPKARKVFLVQYRLGGRSGRTRRITIGTYGSITPEQARTKAKQLLGVVASGLDPRAQKDKDQVTLSVSELLYEYTEKHDSFPLWF